MHIKEEEEDEEKEKGRGRRDREEDVEGGEKGRGRGKGGRNRKKNPLWAPKSDTFQRPQLYNKFEPGVKKSRGQSHSTNDMSL